MFSGTRAACADTAVALCLTQETNGRRIKEWHKGRPYYAHENLMADVMMSEPKYFFLPPV
jgi:hypothetical protein